MRHTNRKNCRCPPYKNDHEREYKDLNQCCRTATLLKSDLFHKFTPDFLPLKDGLSLIPKRKWKNKRAKEKKEEITFNLSMTDPEEIDQVIRVFAKERNNMLRKLPLMCHHKTGGLQNNDQEITAYTDSSSSNNGMDNSRVGSGVWFGENNQMNASIRVGFPNATNQTGELVLILTATQRVPPDKKLNIISDSQYAIDSLTSNLESRENRGWVGLSNKEPF